MQPQLGSHRLQVCLTPFLPRYNAVHSSNAFYRYQINRTFTKQQAIQRQFTQCNAASSADNNNGNDINDEGLKAELEENPILKDFLFGEGSSGIPGERPEDAPEQLASDEIIEALSMGTWRLRSSVCPQIQALVSQVEGAWRSILGRDDLSIYSLPDRMKYLDSLDPTGAKPMSYVLPGPEKDEEGWPRLQIENRAYSSFAFRKLHIEVAVRQDGLQVFHCVMYPRIEFDLPTLSMDVVAMNDRITFAIADPCPVSPDKSLPNIYYKPVMDLQERFNVGSNRGAPDWGQNIFSDLCVIMRPTTPAEVGAFIKYAIALTNFHVQIGKLATPVSGDNRQRRIARIHAAHERYRDNQLKNDKTRKVLEKAFGEALTDDYMTKLMFDVEELPYEP